MDCTPASICSGTSTYSSGCGSSLQCHPSPSRCSQFIWWLSMEHMGMSVFPYVPLFNSCSSLARVYPELFASRSQVLQLWKDTKLQIFDHRVWIQLTHVAWSYFKDISMLLCWHMSEVLVNEQLLASMLPYSSEHSWLLLWFTVVPFAYFLAHSFLSPWKVYLRMEWKRNQKVDAKWMHDPYFVIFELLLVFYHSKTSCKMHFAVLFDYFAFQGFHSSHF